MNENPAALPEQKAPTLLDLLDEGNEITRAIVESEGEITPQIEEWMNDHEKNIAKKVDAIAWVDKTLEEQAESFKEKALQYSRIAKGFESARDFMRTRIKGALLFEKTDHIEGFTHSIKLVHSGFKVDTTFSPEDEKNCLAVAETQGFARVKTTVELDKDKIKESLKEGNCPLDFVRLLPIYSLRFPVSKPKVLKGKKENEDGI